MEISVFGYPDLKKEVFTTCIRMSVASSSVFLNHCIYVDRIYTKYVYWGNTWAQKVILKYVDSQSLFWSGKYPKICFYLNKNRH